MKSMFNLILILSILFCVNTPGIRTEFNEEKATNAATVLTKSSPIQTVIFSVADIGEEKEESEEESSNYKSNKHHVSLWRNVSFFELYDINALIARKRKNSISSYSSPLVVNVRSVIFLI